MMVGVLSPQEQWQTGDHPANHGDFCDSKSDFAGQMEVPSRLSPETGGTFEQAFCGRSGGVVTDTTGN